MAANPVWGDAEWLEADGLGGFASGPVAGPRTRRYHALLLAAKAPPAERVVFVSGFDAFVETDVGREALSAQRYADGTVAPDGAAQLVDFSAEPWPRWTFELEGGARVVQELSVPRGAPLVALSFRLEGGGGPARLELRPFLAAREYHALQREDGRLSLRALVDGASVRFAPRADQPRIVALSNGAFRDEPHWYRGFAYETERARGLDHLEDLPSPGVFGFDLAEGEALLVFAAELPEADPWLRMASVEELFARLRGTEAARRAELGGRLERAADAYVVRRGSGRTIVAGYPWFTDWGRDTFIALRGLCLATGRLDEAGQILLEWSGAVSQGMLPNRFQDQGDEPEYNSVDAALWYVVALHEYLEALARRGGAAHARERERLQAAVLNVLDGHLRGTRHGIRVDDDGLLRAGETGLQLTWMDAKVGEWVVTPRIGKPVEVQALWINALRVGAAWDARFGPLAERALASFRGRFWNAGSGCLYDVVDVDHVPGRNDASLRPNQILAVGGLPFALLEGAAAQRVVDVVQTRLLAPLGLRSLAREEPGYCPRYEGGPRERDGAYHQGTVWPWLLGPFVEAWLRVRGDSPAAREQARREFLEPLLRHLDEAGLGHVSEVADGDAPHRPGGCPFQAWSVGEALRLERVVLAPSASSSARPSGL